MPVKFKDYYEVMGVGRDATQDEIKRAYRRLARQYHPDVSKAPDAEARFKELGEANAVLKNVEKRAAYDQLGRDWKSGQDFQAPPDWDAGFEYSGGKAAGGTGDGFSDFFESLFGQRGGARGAADFHARGGDHHARVFIDLEDAYAGAIRDITLQVAELDPRGRPSSRPRTLKVTIPRGLRAGQQIRLHGQGRPGTGDGEAGDLYLEVGFRPHAHYRVQDRDVYLDLPLAPWEAALGATVTVPTPEGELELRIPPGSAAGGKLRLKGRGIPGGQGGGPAGDLYAVLQLSLPPADSDAASALYRGMGEAFKTFRPRAALGV